MSHIFRRLFDWRVFADCMRSTRRGWVRLRGDEPPTAIRDPLIAACLDCGLDYSEFGVDLLLPRSQWLLIHPDENGLLCALCIAKRAARIGQCCGIRGVLEIRPEATR